MTYSLIKLYSEFTILIPLILSQLFLSSFLKIDFTVAVAVIRYNSLFLA
jgi:hypothetical protein